MKNKLGRRRIGIHFHRVEWLKFFLNLNLISSTRVCSLNQEARFLSLSVTPIIIRSIARARLSRSNEGRKILVKIRWTELDAIPRVQIPDPWRQSIITRPLTRNMNPSHHEARRAARARKLTRTSAKTLKSYTPTPPGPGGSHTQPWWHQQRTAS